MCVARKAGYDSAAKVTVWRPCRVITAPWYCQTAQLGICVPGGIKPDLIRGPMLISCHKPLQFLRRGRFKMRLEKKEGEKKTYINIYINKDGETGMLGVWETANGR